MRHPCTAHTILLLAAAYAGCSGDAPTNSSTQRPPPRATVLYVSPTGHPEAVGTIDRPFALGTVMANSELVPPGSTVWLRGGTYAGSFTSRLTGTADAPVVMRQYAGERAVIDGNLAVSGPHATYWGFEVTNSAPEPGDVTAVDVSAPGVKLINLVIHDAGGNGLGVWAGATDAEVHGNILYNNGRQRVTEGFAHGVYAQNASGTQRYTDNVVFNQFAYGFHIYGSESASLRGFHLEGNVAFENGAPASARGSVNVLVGGASPASAVQLVDNHAYKSTEGTNVRLGLEARNADVSVRGNVIAGGSPALWIQDWASATVSGNTLVGGDELVHLEGPLGGFSWSGNTHYREPSAQAWTTDGTGRTFAGFSTAARATGDRAVAGLPNADRVVVRPNQYERGRAHVIVYDWTGASSVSVDLSRVLSNGDRYEILNVQDLFGEPVATGSYAGGSVTLPIRAVAPPVPVGGFVHAAAGTGTRFGVYLVRLLER